MHPASHEQTTETNRRGAFVRRVARAPWAVAAVVLAVYGIWLLMFFVTGHDPRDFAQIDRYFAERSQSSPTSWYDPHYHYSRGYDGQFSYYLAVDPVHAHEYIDIPLYPPAYRYTRILYPAVARLLAFGQAGLVPYALILVNWLVAGGGTLAIATWLRRNGCSPWLAIVFGLAFGVFFGLFRDLNEPLAFALVALALYLFDFGGQRRLLWSGLAFAGALLARESVGIFPLVCGLAALLQGAKPLRARIAEHWPAAVLFLGISFTPFVIYKIFLLVWLGSVGVPAQVAPQIIPLSGLFALWPWRVWQVWQLLTVVLPAGIVASLAVRAVQRGLGTVAVWALLANALLYIVMLWPVAYQDPASPARISLGVVLAALYCVPVFDRLTHGRRRWLTVCAGLWMGTTFVMLAVTTASWLGLVPS